METSPNKLRVMVDANILIAGTIWPRWPYEVLRHALRQDFQMVLSNYIIQQSRTQIQRIFPDHIDRFDKFLQNSVYDLVDDPTYDEVSQNLDLVRDSTDVPVALAAIKGRVDILVSEDKDLSVQDVSTEKLRKELRVMISGTFLREIMGWKSEMLEAVRKRTWRDFDLGDTS